MFGGTCDSLSHPASVCIFLCARLCVFLVMFWNPKQVITPVAEEFQGKMCLSHLAWGLASGFRSRLRGGGGGKRGPVVSFSTSF